MSPANPLPLDHGAIGNGRVLALVAPTTHIDWLCMPRFDSPSVFARILDAEKGGTFAILPASDDYQTRMEYVVNTNVLRTEVTCGDIEPNTGRLLGNFPQAYTHVGLIHTAITLGELIDARDSRFRAWS